MLEVGDKIRWMCPLDNDYIYGEVVSINKRRAIVRGTGLYKNVKEEVHFRYIEKLSGGGDRGRGTGYRKLYSTED